MNEVCSVVDSKDGLLSGDGFSEFVCLGLLLLGVVDWVAADDDVVAEVFFATEAGVVGH